MRFYIPLDEVGLIWADLVNKHNHDSGVFMDLQMKTFEDLKENMIGVKGEKVFPVLPSPDRHAASNEHKAYLNALRRQHDLHALNQDKVPEKFDNSPKRSRRACVFEFFCLWFFLMFIPYALAIICGFRLVKLTEEVMKMKQVRGL